MFAAMLAVVLSASPDTDAAPGGLLPAVGRALFQGPIAKARYCHWLHSYPYSTAISQQGGYNFRLQQDYPWSVRSGYSLPVWAAADTRVPPAAPQNAPGEPAKKISPRGPAAKSSR